MAGYGTDQGFNDWLQARELTLPQDAPDAAVLRQVGSDYVDAAYGAMLGCSAPAGGLEQERAWPRYGHIVQGENVPEDLVPKAWVNASYRAGYLHAISPGWATNSKDPNRVTRREKADVLEREFFEPGAEVAVGVAADALINAMVAPWLCRTSALFRVI